MSLDFMSRIHPGCRVLKALFVLGLFVIAGAASAATCRVTTTGAGSNSGTSWGNAMTLQTALAAASSCDEVWVKAGTYLPTTGSDRTVSFNILPEVQVYGGFAGGESQRNARNPAANLTILSGDIDDNDINTDGNNIAETSSDIQGNNSHHVVVMDGTQGTKIVASTVLDGFTITGGHADGQFPVFSGGGLYCDGSGGGHECSPTISNVTFSGNSASKLGGAMFNDGGHGASSPALSNVTFSGNSAGNSGGAMYSQGRSGGISSPSLNNVIFSDNSAGVEGGAMTTSGYDGGTISMTLNNVTFSGNSAAYMGGAMENDSFDGASSLSLNNVTFNGNSTSMNGGAMFNVHFADTSSLSLNNVSFRGNSATGSAQNQGGAMYNSDFRGTSSLSLNNVTFIGNSSGDSSGFNGDFGQGGAMYNYACSPSLSNVTFSGNSASNAGGAMFNDGGHGASSPTLSNVTFSGNSATNTGGAIYNLGTNGTSSPTLSNVTFSGNSAGKSGGAMYNSGQDGGTSSPILSNVIAWGNTATRDGPEIFNDDDNGSGVAKPTIDHSVIQGSNGSGGSWDASLGADGGGNLDADPKLGALADNGGATLTMLPGVGSSAIDAGSTCTATDQRGAPRPQGAACDIGAVEVEQYTLTIVVTGSGKVSAGTSPTPLLGGIDNCTSAGGGNCAAGYVPNAVVNLTATAPSGVHFVGWSGACNGGASTSMTMTADTACLATFAFNTNHSIGGMISGLSGSGLKLQVNGGNTLSINPNDNSFAFPSGLVSYGNSYTVTVSSQPTSPAQTCTVSNGSGTMGGSDVTNVAVNCTTNNYTIGGSITGLSGSGLKLQLNGSHDLAVTGNGSFSFPTGIASGTSYAVTVGNQPTSPKQTCSVSNASGTVVNADISNVMVACETATAVLTLSIDDDHEFARYGLTLDYLITLSNTGDATASSVAVMSSLSAGLDSTLAHWQCTDASGGATCTASGTGPLADTATLPENSSLSWMVTVPVKSATPDNTVTMSAYATGATSVSDQDTLAIFRDGFDVANADGTRVTMPAPDSAAILSRDGSDTFDLPPAHRHGIDTIRTLRDGDTTIKVQRLTLGQTTRVRLLQHPQNSEERTSAWVRVAADADLSIGSVAGKDEQRIILLEGASQALSLPLAD